jgi:hypothetical protein
MPGFDRTGPRGMGSMTGGGRGFCSPWGTGVASRPYGRFPRMGYGYPYYGVASAIPGAMPFYQRMTREQELDSLKNQAQEMKVQLEQIESRIQQLGSEV